MTLLLLLACVPDTLAPQDSAPLDTQDEVDDSLPPMPPAYSGGTCPSFADGWVDFQSAGLDRTVKILWPDEPKGAPVWFNWHWLGGSATQASSAQRLSDIAEQGYIVVVPEAHEDALFEWGFPKGADDTADLTLFDDVLSCLIEQFDVDRERVYSTGMSAGALWSTHLAMKRSEYLAAVAPLSGGTGLFQDYSTPERDVPVMLTWGGETDTFNGLSFQDATFEFRDSMIADGSFVVMCEHDGGHTLPPVNLEHVSMFFAAHSYGDELPWEAELPADLWDGCFLPE